MTDISSARDFSDCKQCHKDKDVKKFLHPALEMGCTSCHSQSHQENAKYPKGLFEKGAKLCWGCHDRAKFDGGEVHQPVAWGECLLCHDAHGSGNKHLLNASTPELCFTCHDRTKFEKKSRHAPVAAGMCASCHDPHRSDMNKLLLAAPPDLCFNCHGREDFERENRHPPAAEGLCFSCHNPHASPNPALAHFPINDVCLGCHPEVGKRPHLTVAFSREGHPLKDRREPKSRYGELSCASCHNPHSSDYMALSKFPANSPFDICMNCHEYGK